MTDTAALFEQTAAHDIPAEHPLSRSEGVRIDATLALLPPGVETALDVGCGPGTLLHRLPVPRAYGTDLGWRGLRNVQRPAVRSSILRLPFADASVDLVTCCEVLEHLPPADVAAAVAELCRVARRAVLVTVPYREQLLESSHRCPRCGTEFHLHGHQQDDGEDHHGERNLHQRESVPSRCVMMMFHSSNRGGGVDGHSPILATRVQADVMRRGDAVLKSKDWSPEVATQIFTRRR